jgi:hypothetical protein
MTTFDWAWTLPAQTMPTAPAANIFFMIAIPVSGVVNCVKNITQKFMV